jgi:hypothetical protein
MLQKETLDKAAYTCLLVFYRRLLPLFQFSLSAVTLLYLSQWGEASREPKPREQQPWEKQLQEHQPWGSSYGSISHGAAVTAAATGAATMETAATGAVAEEAADRGH